MASVYGIFFPAVKRVYIGSSEEDCPAKRWWCHLRLLRIGKHHNKAMQAIFARAGEREMILKVLEMCPGPQRFVVEQKWMNLYKARRCCLNAVDSNAAAAAEISAATARLSSPHTEDLALAGRG